MADVPTDRFFTAQGVFVAGMGGENFSKIAKKYILFWKKKNRQNDKKRQKTA